FVHDTKAEEKFVAEGYADKRLPVMYNDFVLIGPKSDPAKVKGNDIVAALKKIAAVNAPFVSRGDKSGTDAAERRLWAQSGLGEAGQQVANDKKGSGYRECGCGMGPALNMAASSEAYVMADRGTWLSFKNRAELAVLVEGDKRLFNQYGVMVVSPAKFPQRDSQGAQKFVDWVTSAAGHDNIASYKIDGHPLFFPNADR
ncbi:MAG: substrate-binding domain-containing protein, partial [Gammaproteobacteria bacterium]|nr:substrate-binding domain-containing protein [Gammaproteobacteria bacterium]